MTVYEDDIPARRRGVGTRVLVLACAILAALGSFWSIVWFIRTYVEPPRVMMPAARQLPARDSAIAPAPAPAPTPTLAAERRPDETTSSVNRFVIEPPPAAETKPVLQAQTASPAPPPLPTPRAAPARESTDPSSGAGSVADRWGPMNQFAPAPAAVAAPPAPAPMPAPPPPAAASAPPAAEPMPSASAAGTPDRDADEVAEGSVPAIEGPAPLPRRRPLVTAQRRNVEPPLPRPRPDGQVAPQSVFTAVPTTDDRYPGQ
jgi:cytoskeletal protein RodZ